ncbi:hypothetical protein Ait01nite_027930 [Actinoplanes italicus]|uniref:Ricin-type beta-trefoil lectin protein n=1 Tax=Actinoplanes italicus TaxID=113567 RepID=A0A2T0KEV2_9ACTN|nr:RICIN domain-containing protein [Actinoplanes italicus]PRX21835.1 ricin-type beta-trefoil lectin protein [Actinoplanes italicus]GIE29748.1 hypothetical protein Ait01nite_027930 [Actinoplanes italicus]
MRLRRLLTVTATFIALAISGAVLAAPASAAPGDITIRHAIYTSSCVEVNSVNIRMYRCGQDPRQRWRQVDLGNGYFMLANRASGGCLLHVWGHITASNQECLAEDSRQWWRWEEQPFGGFLLVNFSGACLSMRNDTSANKNEVRVFDCDGNIKQLFRPIPD